MDREQFKQRAKKNIDELVDMIADLEAKKEVLKGQSRVKYKEIMADIKRIEAEVELRRKKMSVPGNAHWEEAQKAFNNSFESLKQAFRHLAGLFKNPSQNANR